jgi:hypothetical protein
MQSKQWLRAVVLAVFDSFSRLRKSSQGAKIVALWLQNVFSFSGAAKDYSEMPSLKKKGKNDWSVYSPPTNVIGCFEERADGVFLSRSEDELICLWEGAHRRERLGPICRTSRRIPQIEEGFISKPLAFGATDCFLLFLRANIGFTGQIGLVAMRTSMRAKNSIWLRHVMALTMTFIYLLRRNCRTRQRYRLDAELWENMAAISYRTRKTHRGAQSCSARANQNGCTLKLCNPFYVQILYISNFHCCTHSSFWFPFSHQEARGLGIGPTICSNMTCWRAVLLGDMVSVGTLKRT